MILREGNVYMKFREKVKIKRIYIMSYSIVLLIVIGAQILAFVDKSVNSQALTWSIYAVAVAIFVTTFTMRTSQAQRKIKYLAPERSIDNLVIKLNDRLKELYKGNYAVDSIQIIDGNEKSEKSAIIIYYK